MRTKPVRNEGKVQKARSRRVRVAALAVLAVLAIAVLASIALPRNSSQASPKKYKATKEIIFDKSTGTLRKPTAEETDAMVSQISVLTNRSSEGLTVKQTSKGQSVDLHGRFSGVTLGRANADGTTEIRCVFTIAEAAEFLGLEAE